MSFYVIDTWNNNARLSEHACFLRAGREAAHRDRSAAALRDMKGALNRFFVTDENDDRLDQSA